MKKLVRLLHSSCLTMVREVLTVCVGQCGIQMGQAIWEQYCAEHGVTEQGKIPNIPDAGKYDCIYEETQRGQYVPRNLMVDLEPNVIDDVKTSKYSAIFHPDFLLAGREDAANNFYRGHYTNGKEMIDKVNDRLRKLVDNCDNVQGFVVNHAVGGGTGSGLGALILERIAVDYRKKSKVLCSLFLSSMNIKDNMVTDAIHLFSPSVRIPRVSIPYDLQLCGGAVQRINDDPLVVGPY